MSRLTFVSLGLALLIPGGALAQAQTALNELVSFTVPDGWERLDVDEAEVWLTRRDGDTSRAQARLMIRLLDARPGAVTSHGASVLSEPTAPQAQTLGELPVWRMTGQAAHGAAPRGQWHADTVITQVCAPQGGPIALTLLDDDAGTSVVDVLQSLDLSVSAAMVGCGSDALADEVLAMIAAGEEAAANRPLAPFPLVAVPTDWAVHERFGLRFRTPVRLQVRTDNARGGRMGYALIEGEEFEQGMNVGLRLLEAGEDNELEALTPRSAEMVAAISELVETPVEATGQQLVLGDMVMDIYRGAGTDSGMPMQTVVALAEAPNAQGYQPAFAARMRGFEQETGFTVLNQIVSSLSATDEPVGPSRRITLFDGRATLRAPSISGVAEMEVREVSQGNSGAEVVFSQSGGDAPNLVFTLRLAPPDGAEALAEITSEFAGSDEAETALTQSGAVWLRRTDRGAVRIAYQQCIDDRLVFVTLEPRRGDLPFDPALYFTETDFVAIDPNLAVTDCLQGTEPAQTGTAAIAPVMPPASGGKDPVAAGPSADTLAWESALAADTPEAIIDYLTRYPGGAHMMDAQAWLTAYAEAEAARAAAAAQAAMAQAGGAQAGGAGPNAGVLANLGDDDTLGRVALADGSAPMLWTYLKAYPEGIHASAARAMLAGEPVAPASK